MQLSSKNRTKKEPPISQKSLFYAISLKFICCLHYCLLHIKFDQIMLYMAHSSQSVCLFFIPITCIPDHPYIGTLLILNSQFSGLYLGTRKHSASFLAHACTTNPFLSGLKRNRMYLGSPSATIVE